MTSYVLILLFANTYGLSTVSVDFESLKVCEAEGRRVTYEVPDAKYFCIERK